MRGSVAPILVIALTGASLASCGGSSDDSDGAQPAGSTTVAATTTVETTSTTDAPPATTVAPEATTTSTTTELPTTTAAPTSTTVAEPAFDLAAADEYTSNSINGYCAWAKEVRSGYFGLGDLDLFKNQVLAGELPPFETALADLDLEQLTEEQVRTAILPVCDDLGAPTEVYLAQF